MPLTVLTLDALSAWARGLSVDGAEWPSQTGTVLVVDLDIEPTDPVCALDSGAQVVVIGQTSTEEPETHPRAAACDVVLGRDDPALDAIADTVARHPIAASALAALLRGSELRSIDDGLIAESAVYSALQAGPEFAAWRAGRPSRDRGAESDPVRLERSGDVLHITLERPHVRNALNTAMRDQLVDAFGLVALDPSLREVHLRGAGDSFCTGGDLDEFGSFVDPASAHLLRLQQSAGRGIAAVAERVTAHLHGACIGSGIELPAFAARVVADPSTLISLPEVSLGLIPGAGGTVSLPRRIGRHRTARLALTGQRINAATAHKWGLIDAIEGPRA